jgi:hypothetical protein
MVPSLWISLLHLMAFLSTAGRNGIVRRAPDPEGWKNGQK